MTIPFTPPQQPPTPAQDVEDLCARLPHIFRLTERQTGHSEGAHGQRTPFTYRNLEVDLGPEWAYSGLHLEDGVERIQEDERGALALTAVLSYCSEHHLTVTLGQSPQRHWTQSCMVVIGVPPVSGLATFPGSAAVRALAAYLRAVGA